MVSEKKKKIEKYSTTRIQTKHAGRFTMRQTFFFVSVLVSSVVLLILDMFLNSGIGDSMLISSLLKNLVALKHLYDEHTNIML